MNMQHIKHVYFVGIKGVAMTALALYFHGKGIRVSGSDVKEGFPTDDMLSKHKIQVLEGFTSSNINSSDNIDLLIYTGAHDGKNNPEVIRALELGIPFLPHGKALGLCMDSTKQISVAGSHGKTTTSAMIATVLSHAGKNPSYAIGCGEIFPLGSPGAYGKGEWCVAEADEYATDPKYDKTPRFLFQHPDIFAVTNIDYDHPDVYSDISAIQAAFVSMKANFRGLSIIVLNADDPNSSCLQTDPKGKIITYGSSKGSDFRILKTSFSEGKTECLYSDPDGVKRLFQLNIPGDHNVSNALCAIAALRLTGLSFDEIHDGLQSFRGSKRRFEQIGSNAHALFYDDYAHHPKEIAATLLGIRQWYPDRKIYCIFQPHTYSRTKALLEEFSTSFGDADTLVLVDIYASARESENEEMTGEILASECRKNHADVNFVHNEKGVDAFLQSKPFEKAVIVFMGAGDIYLWGKRIADSFSTKGKRT
ncbi:MAG: UDP-N-acetylmuramate--L-alanine ligase [Patescibacteria group bacterium]